MNLTDNNIWTCCGIYCIINNINGHQYIGQAKNIKNRIYEHLISTYKNSKSDYTTPLHGAIRKYGIDNFTLELLERCSYDELNNKEQYWISFYHTYKYDPEWTGGYNLTAGGKQSVRKIKLTKQQVQEIYDLLANSSLSAKTIAEQFSISRDFVNKINVGAAWHDNTLDYPIRKTIVVDVYSKYNFDGTCVCQIDLETGKILNRFISTRAASVEALHDITKRSHIKEAILEKRTSAYGFGWTRADISKEDWLVLLNRFLAISL